MRARSSSGSSRTNDWVAIFLVAVAALSAIPFGSNRPVFWALWALVCAVAFGASRLTSNGRRAGGRFDASSVRVEQGLFWTVAAALLVQLAPIGDVLPLHWPMEATISQGIASLSVSPGDTWFAFLRWMTYGILFTLTLQAGVNGRRNRFLASALALVIAAEAIYALVALAALGDTILIFDKVSYFGVATGTFVNRNSLATFLGIGAVLALSEMLRDRSEDGVRRERERRAIFALAFGFIVATLLATQSRMGLVATGCGLLTVLVLQRRRMSSGVWLIPIAAAAVAMAYLYGNGLIDRAFRVEWEAQSRSELYRQVLAMIAHRPWLGFGAGTFQIAFPIFQEPSLSPDHVWDYAHSTYLSLWAGLGVVVGSLPMVIVGSFFVRMAIVRRRGGAMRLASRGNAIPAALGATVLVALHSLVDFSLEMQAIAIAYTITLALGVAEAMSGMSSADRTSSNPAETP